MKEYKVNKMNFDIFKIYAFIVPFWSKVFIYFALFLYNYNNFVRILKIIKRRR